MYQLRYRLTGELTRNPFKGKGARPPVQSNGIGAAESYLATFTFLNQSYDFGTVEGIDWNYAGYGKLWTYNLNYFEFLRAPSMTLAEGEALIADWVAKSTDHQDGWEPYPLSLRIVSWTLFYQERQTAPPDWVKHSLNQQHTTLAGKLEYHLGGNHLLENAIALAFGPYRNDALLLGQLNHQYLADGAHYELSVMYHLILLDRLLDLYQYLPHGDALCEPLQASLDKQLAWAAAMIADNGQYPHFNDSTDGVAPPWPQIATRATELKLSLEKGQLSACGYRRWDFGAKTHLWVDVAAIGATEIPGHAHADTLTFCLTENGKPVIVDTSISTYEKNHRRAYERGTAGHNTLVPSGGGNSSDVWGGFRVGRRARTIIYRDEPTVIDAGHDGWSAEHRRTFTRASHGFSITDRYPGSATVFFHLAEGVEVDLTGTGAIVDGCTITWQGGEARLEDYQLATGFNRLVPAVRIVLTFAGRLDCRFAFTDQTV